MRGKLTKGIIVRHDNEADDVFTVKQRHCVASGEKCIHDDDEQQEDARKCAEDASSSTAVVP